MNKRLTELDRRSPMPKSAMDVGISRKMGDSQVENRRAKALKATEGKRRSPLSTVFSLVTLRLLCIFCLTIACLNPSIVSAGCGEYVFDRLHPQTISIPGLTLYRLPYNPHHQYDHNTDQFLPQSISEVTKDSHWGSDKLNSLGNRFPISEVSIRYSARPVPCHGPSCRSQNERPFGMAAAVIIDFENNGPQAACEDQVLKQIVATPTDWMCPNSLSFETQFCDRLYRPPS